MSLGYIFNSRPAWDMNGEGKISEGKKEGSGGEREKEPQLFFKKIKSQMAS